MSGPPFLREIALPVSIGEFLQRIARARPEQLDCLYKECAAVYSAGKLSDSQAQRVWQAIHWRRKAQARLPTRSLLLQPKQGLEPRVFGPAGGFPCGNFSRDPEQWKRQIVSDAELLPLAFRLGSLLEAKYLCGDPRDPFYLHAWPALETLARDLKSRNQNILDARLELEGRGHIKVTSRRGRKRTTIIGLLFKPAEEPAVVAERPEKVPVTSSFPVFTPVQLDGNAPSESTEISAVSTPHLADTEPIDAVSGARSVLRCLVRWLAGASNLVLMSPYCSRVARSLAYQ